MKNFDEMRVLVAGWFSFEDMGVTAGDLMAKDVVCSWLSESGITYDVALIGSLADSRSVNWQQVDPQRYSDIIFVCGPFGNGWPVTDLLSRFSHCRLTGMNLSLLQRLDEWNPFELLYERDNFYVSYPDLALAGKADKVPVVGVVLAHRQKEYGARCRHDEVNEAIQRLIGSTTMSVVPIDTALQNNKGGLRTAAEVESLIAAMDVVVTTRLHGTVLAIKNAVPVIAVDPIAGGAKIALQVKALGWPVSLIADQFNDRDLLNAFHYCNTEDAATAAAGCRGTAMRIIAARKKDFQVQFKQLGALVT